MWPIDVNRVDNHSVTSLITLDLSLLRAIRIAAWPPTGRIFHSTSNACLDSLTV